MITEDQADAWGGTFRNDGGSDEDLDSDEEAERAQQQQTIEQHLAQSRIIFAETQPAPPEPEIDEDGEETHAARPIAFYEVSKSGLWLRCLRSHVYDSAPDFWADIVLVFGREKDTNADWEAPAIHIYSDGDELEDVDDNKGTGEDEDMSDSSSDNRSTSPPRTGRIAISSPIMAAEASGAPAQTFERFSELQSELRIEIWRWAPRIRVLPVIYDDQNVRPSTLLLRTRRNGRLSAEAINEMDLRDEEKFDLAMMIQLPKIRNRLVSEKLGILSLRRIKPGSRFFESIKSFNGIKCDLRDEFKGAKDAHPDWVFPRTQILELGYGQMLVDEQMFNLDYLQFE
ncbi:uncharacterized protein PAC_05550 [Phialocephala subalpina]|uniref:Uncharacterized protein n=1 Tax=Phialocephala subalpina TaxID=576137 RepID=A0A1L7WSB4_9HELO|nr:uncharacterized protein PAC_05550 [Phialocephala subalpina]